MLFYLEIFHERRKFAATVKEKLVCDFDSVCRIPTTCFESRRRTFEPSVGFLQKPTLSRILVLEDFVCFVLYRIVHSTICSFKSPVRTNFRDSLLRCSTQVLFPLSFLFAWLITFELGQKHKFVLEYLLPFRPGSANFGGPELSVPFYCWLSQLCGNNRQIEISDLSIVSLHTSNWACYQKARQIQLVDSTVNPSTMPTNHLPAKTSTQSPYVSLTTCNPTLRWLLYSQQINSGADYFCRLPPELRRRNFFAFLSSAALSLRVLPLERVLKLYPGGTQRQMSAHQSEADSFTDCTAMRFFVLWVLYC